MRHTPFVVDLVNSGSLLIPDLKINISERFVDPGSRKLLYIPYSNKATLYVYGRRISKSLVKNINKKKTTQILGDLVSPGFFKSHLTSMNTADQYHDSAEGYMYDFAVNLQTLRYLEVLGLLHREETDQVLEYMQVGKSER